MTRGLTALALAIAMIAPARAQPLIADLSSHLIEITAGFSGTEVLLFGATEGEGDVIVVMRGPESRTTVRRKARIAGIWINRDEIGFDNVPVFYRLAASRPIEEMTTPAIRQRHQLGVDHLRLGVEASLDAGEVAMFRQGLVRNKERQGLFAREAGRVTFLGQRLFRTRVFLPANVPPGSYTVEVLLVRGGQVIAAQTTPLLVSKTGIGAEIYDFAHRQAALHGILAVAIAAFAGWAAGAIFRKG
jgi:uncharacterized protein (TIGR02186 family)